MTKAIHKKKTKAFEVIVRYALAKYGDKFDIASPDCPYETRMGGDRGIP